MITIPAIDMVRTGRNIAVLRQRAGLSVRDLQTAFGFATPQAIYKWQHGAAMPTIDNLVALAVLFQVRIDDIIIVDGDAEADHDDEREDYSTRYDAVCVRYGMNCGRASALVQERIPLAGFSACGGSLQRHNSAPPQIWSLVEGPLV